MSSLFQESEIKIADFFGGVGGFRRGAELCFGEERVKATVYCEKDRHAAKTYHARWPEQKGCFFIQDIKHITERATPIRDQLPSFDLMFAGFPCQPFSLMGKQRGFEDERGNLFFDLLKILEACQPKAFVFENVKRLITLNQGSYFQAILNALKNLDYQVSYHVLNSANYGVPQKRQRVFFVGVRRTALPQGLCAPHEIPPLNSAPKTIHDILEREVSEKYYLSERTKRTVLSYGTGGWFAKPEINRELARPLTKTMHKMHRASQDNYYTDEYISCGHQPPLDQEGLKIRRLTPLEAFRLQGFDDEFVHAARAVGVSDTQLYMQAGNAVTTTVVGALLRAYFIDNTALSASSSLSSL